jgi:hypothetical protein
MARFSRTICLCAAFLLGLVCTGNRGWSAPPGAEGDNALTAALKVQTAMQQAREYLVQHQGQAAVELLEAQLPRINGNPLYLALLRDAYRACIRELRVNGRDADAQLYIKRLQILEPGALIEERLPAPKLIARGKPAEDDDPFRRFAEPLQKRGPDLLALAEKKFSENSFAEAGALFTRLQTSDRALPPENRVQLAYCKLYGVVDQLNRKPPRAAIGELETEVRKAIELAPSLDFGRQLLAEIEKRKRDEQAKSTEPEEERAPQVAVRHSEQRINGWAVVETANFRIFHNQPAELAEQAARVAEATRWRMQRRWFGAAGQDWNPRCDIFLHATAHDYSQATSVAPTSPGHSSFSAPGPMMTRRIDLHCDDLNLIVAVLPHETTHTVLAGNFGGDFVPRWADEGMAVLTEPRDKIERHLRNLPRHRAQNELFRLHQLVQMRDYPDPRYVGAFYAQSVSLVDFLVREKGAQVFTRFLREGMQGNYEAALQRHYGYRSFAELEQRWVRAAFPEASTTGVALAPR